MDSKVDAAIDCIGIDEAGRGPLAGPVVAVAAYLPPDIIDDPIMKMLDDSKKVRVKIRENLYNWLLDKCFFAIGISEVPTIESVNILQATLIAMRSAYHSLLSQQPDLENKIVLIDGNQDPIQNNSKAIIKGDALIPTISAASIIAKVYRDKLMQHLHEQDPRYGWDINKGYGTLQHRHALQKFGPSIHHRKLFIRNITSNTTKDHEHW